MIPAAQLILTNRRNAVLAAIAVLLAATCLWRAQMTMERPALPPIPSVTSEQPVRGDKFQAKAWPPIGVYSEASERPLFNPNRKRFIEAVPDATVAAPSNRPFRVPVLLGIAGSGERRVALVKLPDERDSRRLRVGDSHDGWTVAEIGRDIVVFKSGNEQREVRLVAAKDGVGANMTAGTGRR